MSIDRGHQRKLHTFVRTRYFYGQLLDVEHFEAEQRYFNEKRWMLNRLVAGYGVVCGLDVRPTDDGKAVQIQPGFAIDRCGREIIVPRPAISEELPKADPQHQPEGEYDEHCDPKNWVHVSLCYHECLSGPERVTISECDSQAECENGEVRERFEIVIEDGKVEPPDLNCPPHDALVGGRLRYDELVRRVSECCPVVNGDCCIPLANVRKPDGETAITERGIDITVRPIVYTNRMLFDLICNLASDRNNRHRNGNA
jgi:hypothetical protein